MEILLLIPLMALFYTAGSHYLKNNSQDLEEAIDDYKKGNYDSLIAYFNSVRTHTISVELEEKIMKLLKRYPNENNIKIATQMIGKVEHPLRPTWIDLSLFSNASKEDIYEYIKKYKKFFTMVDKNTHVDDYILAELFDMNYYTDYSYKFLIHKINDKINTSSKHQETILLLLEELIKDYQPTQDSVIKKENKEDFITAIPLYRSKILLDKLEKDLIIQPETSNIKHKI